MQKNQKVAKFILEIIQYVRCLDKQNDQTKLLYFALFYKLVLFF